MTTVTEEITSFLVTSPDYSDEVTNTSPDPRDDPDLVNSANTKELIRAFKQFAYVPIACCGVLGNLVSTWVWQADTVYNPTVFLLKVLAVWDTVYCLGHLIVSVLDLIPEVTSPPALSYTLTIAVLVSQICSIYTTLMSSVTRLVAIYRPTQFHFILSRPRVVALCAAILFWSVLLTSLEISWYVCLLAYWDCQHLFQMVSFYRKHYLYDLLAFCVPSLILLCCNVLTVWKVFRHEKNISTSSSNQSQGDKTRRLSITMVVISMTSLVTYPVAVSVRVGLNPGQTESAACDIYCYYVVVYFCAVLTLFNSCINIVYYCAISSRFRELWKLRVSKLC